MDCDSFILQYIEDHGTYGDTSPFLIHVRIATHGSVTLANCHPFHVPLQGGSEMVLIHNGIIDKVSDAIKGTDLTDTQGLVKYVLADMGDEWLDNDYLADYVEDFIGWSKIVFLTTNPELSKEMYILNEDSGVWRDKVWYSNWSCFKYGGWSKSIRPKRIMTSQDSCDISDWYKENDSKRYASYDVTTGEYVEGTVTGRGTTDDFEDWLVDPSERRVQAIDLADATQDEHIEIMNASLHEGDACAVCTGIIVCLCDDLCYLCYETYQICDCKGSFVSLTQSFGETWGDRTIAIASAGGDDEQGLAF